jgi:hypothetical protein
LKILGIEQKEEKSGILVKGINGVEQAIKVYFDEVSEIERPLIRILEEMKKSLSVEESSVHFFGWDENEMENKSSIFIRRIDPNEDWYLVRLNVSEEMAARHVADAMGAEIATESINIKIKIEPVEDDKFLIDCNILAEVLKNRLFDDFELSGTQLALRLLQTRSEMWTLIYKNDHLRLRMTVKNVAGPWSSDGKKLLWHAEDGLIQGPIHEEWSKKYKYEKIIPTLILEISNSNEYDRLELPIFGEELLRESREIASEIMAKVSMLK